ncbi:hypothetical protein Emed_005289 [Eimeria media]
MQKPFQKRPWKGAPPQGAPPPSTNKCSLPSSCPTHIGGPLGAPQGAPLFVCVCVCWKMSSRSSLDEDLGLHALDLEEEEGEAVFSDAAYTSAVEELLYNLKNLDKEPFRKKEGNERGGGPPRGLLRSRAKLTRLGPADRFAVMVSGFSLFILLFIFVSKTSRFIRKKARALYKKTWRGAPFLLTTQHTETEEGAPSSSAPEDQKGPLSTTVEKSQNKEEPAETNPPTPASVAGERGPPTGGRGGRGPPEGPPEEEEKEKEKEKEEEEEEEIVKREERGPMLRGRMRVRRPQPRRRRKAPKPSRLMAINPALRKEEKKLRALEEVLLLLELDRFPQPGPEEFVLGVLSRVLDVQHLGGHSDL